MFRCWKARELNKHFATVGDRLAQKIDITFDAQSVGTSRAPTFELKEISREDLARAVRDMKPSSPCGVDGLNACLIKLAGPALLAPLLHIINLNINLGIFPDTWN